MVMARFDPFFLMSDAELEAAIRDLAAQLASGTTQVSSPEGGSAGYVGRAEASRIMKSLQRSYFARRGEVLHVDRVRYTIVNPRASYE